MWSIFKIPQAAIWLSESGRIRRDPQIKTVFFPCRFDNDKRTLADLAFFCQFGQVMNQIHVSSWVQVFRGVLQEEEKEKESYS